MSHWGQFKHLKLRAATSCQQLVGCSIKPLLAVLLVSWVQAAAPAAESSALIVTGISPTADDAAKFLSLATETKRLLVERGLPESRVEILHENVTRDLVLRKLQAVTASTNDEFWLVLYGISGGRAATSRRFKWSARV